MAFALNQQFAIGVSRRVYQIYHAIGAAAPDEWRAVALCNADSFLLVNDANIGVSLFPVTGFAAAPAPFSSFGDRVVFQSYPAVFGGTSLSNAPLADPSPLAGKTGIVQNWVTTAGVTTAIVAVPNGDGTDSWFFALPAELALAKRNPFFGP